MLTKMADLRTTVWRPGASMNAEQAHRLLDLVKAGVTVPAALVNAALVATGDLTNPQEDEDE